MADYEDDFEVSSTSTANSNVKGKPPVAPTPAAVLPAAPTPPHPQTTTQSLPANVQAPATVTPATPATIGECGIPQHTPSLATTPLNPVALPPPVTTIVQAVATQFSTPQSTPGHLVNVEPGQLVQAAPAVSGPAPAPQLASAPEMSARDQVATHAAPLTVVHAGEAVLPTVAPPTGLTVPEQKGADPVQPTPSVVPNVVSAPPESSSKPLTGNAEKGVSVSRSFGGMNLVWKPEPKHKDPHTSRLATLTEKLAAKEKSHVEYAREQLLKRELLKEEFNAKLKQAEGKENSPKKPSKAAMSTALVVPALPPNLLFAALDEKFPTVTDSTLCGIAFYHGHERMLKELENLSTKKCINVWSYVPYRGRYYGIKKQGSGYTLGLGSKGTPLHFACLAARVDVVATLLQNGAKYKFKKADLQGSPSPFQIVKQNGVKAICELFQAYSHEAEEQAKKRKNLIIGAQIRYERDLRKARRSRSRGSSTERSESLRGSSAGSQGRASAAARDP